MTVSIADAGGLSVDATYRLVDWTGTTTEGVEAGDFKLKPGGPVKAATFSIKENVLQVKIYAVGGRKK